jgi:tRNA-2-methylthio-N6-dimethylallyladenosine synthase
VEQALKDAKYFLETFGCQMNILDSQLVAGQLCARGMQPVSDYRQADVILFNTCSVRQHAEDKVLSRLGALKSFKHEQPERIIGVIGCMAEREKEGLFVRAPHIDLLCGPGELNALPALIEEVWQRRARVTALAGSLSRRTEVLQRALEYDSLEALDLSRAAGIEARHSLQSYIRVQRGCDKFCTYCVVPFTRGPERSRPAAHIVEEARMLADRGCREITLLGQTVNSYVHQDDGQAVPFANLLERIHDVDGIDRIRFVTSFPADWDEDIFRVMRDYPRVMPYLHIPAQSGSDRILAAMKRTYTADSYLRLMDTARKYVPDIALAGDMIVGFCTETDEDFRKTVEMVRRVEYSNLFVFKYSPRPGTKADRNRADDVPEEVKAARCNELIALHKEIGAKLRARRVGHEVEVLVEGYSKAARKARGQSQSEMRTRQHSSPSLGSKALGAGRRARRADNGPAGALARREWPANAHLAAHPSDENVATAPRGGRSPANTPAHSNPTPSDAEIHQESEQDRGTEVSRQRSNQLVGRSPHDQIVVFEAPPEYIGSIVKIIVDEATPTTLLGRLTEVISPPVASGPQARRLEGSAGRVALPVVSS